MPYLLDATVLDDARKLGGFTSDEKLANHIGMSSSAIRNLRSGRSEPSIATLAKLRAVTGRSFDGMVHLVPGELSA